MTALEKFSDSLLKGWVTINGTHVFIGESDEIEKGPEALVGKKPDADSLVSSLRPVKGSKIYVHHNLKQVSEEQYPETVDRENAHKTTLPIDSLVATQPYVDKEKIKHFIQNPSRPEDEPILVRRYRGSNFIMDGHHAVVAAKLRGEKEVSVLFDGPNTKGMTNFINSLCKADYVQQFADSLRKPSS